MGAEIKTKNKADDLDYKIGRRLARLREERGFTQREFCDELDTTKAQYSRYENGHNQIKLKTAVILLNKMNLPFHVLTDPFSKPPTYYSAKFSGRSSQAQKPIGMADNDQAEFERAEAQYEEDDFQELLNLYEGLSSVEEKKQFVRIAREIIRLNYFK